MNESCYGQKKKEQLVINYEVEPILYLKLLANQEKNGCCGKLTDSYYIFTAIHQSTRKESTFFVGKHCAEEILKLVTKPPLPLFNPLRIDQQNLGQANNGNVRPHNRPNIHPVNRALIRAIAFISMSWNRPPSSGLLKIINFTNNRPNYINHKGVKWVNEYIINYDEQNRTLQQMYLELRAENPNMRDFNFDVLRNSFIENNLDIECFF